MTPERSGGNEHGIRYHAPRHRDPGPVVGVAATLLILLVGGQLVLASDAPGDAPLAAPVVSSSPSVGPTPTATETATPTATETAADPSEAATPTPTPTRSATAPDRDPVELVFDSGADTPAPGAADALDDVVGELMDDPEATVRVVGHAEPSNDPDLERQLSLERALRVVDLLGRRGVTAERVQVVAAGSTQAGAAGPTAVNSRVTVEVAPG